jgi:opacity protein-like surface antigen
VSGRITAIVLTALCLLPAPAAADWFVAPYFGVRFAADTTFFLGFRGTQKDKATFGSSVGFLTDGVFGVEADVGVIPGFFDRTGVTGIVSSRVTTIMGNAIFALPLNRSRYGLRPYAIAGSGLLRSRADSGLLNEDIESDVLGLSVGGGAIGPLTQRTSLRFDLRYFRNLSTDEDTLAVNTETRAKVSFWRATVGLSFGF